MNTPSVTLNNSVSMPILGLGVWQVDHNDCERAVSIALESGYRHIDTAAAYGNEADVGLAIQKSGLAREEIFVTTKLWNADQGYEKALRAFETSLKNLRLDFVDLYLIHWPQTATRADSWRALEKLYEGKQVRAVGVSNYTTAHLDELAAQSDLTPTVNQVEFHPFLNQHALLKHCQTLNTQLEAYSPLARGQKMNDKTLLSIGKKHHKSPAQIMIRWCIEQNVVVIPKSVTPERIRENAAVFDFKLDDNDMLALAALNEDLRLCWDPTPIR